MRTLASLVTGLAMVTALLPATAARGRVLPLPITIQMDGYVGPPPHGRHEVADLRLGIDRDEVRFQVTNARLITGGTTAAAVFRQVRPLRPNFRLRGTPELLGRVAGAAPAAQLRITGTWRPGSRDLLLSSVEARPAVETPPSARQPAAP